MSSPIAATPPQPTPPPEKVFALPQRNAQALVDYLAKQPCGEVYALVGMLLTLQEAPKAIEVAVQPTPDETPPTV